ncbi:tRNA (uridine(54)-C5)-methyltransferase TrmA [Marinimicrobium sp. ABcell2]|uniref:tRNA (uridine(54)-C5)-methyltransferase TrmA n=1 Tax=Marinimicrobium sp. ABcell2 TaxID=3069751 RepID=UPI0027B70574|nr:tRNA (uridine(54)-C5)-methyltransferase TrmA [Marinimicrobium sp. ABcell2]MDQ2078018.1 tRNA (uridine(54)-C5)-methyltransferase TrmA [Marinimicrobium sp. ABcell2]
MPINRVFPQQYQEQLNDKVSRIKEDFSPFNPPEIEVFSSPKSHYRMRAEFKIWHEGDRAHYAMFEPGEYKRPFVIDEFPVASQKINELMPVLLEAVNADPLLRQRLFQMEFLTTLSGDALVSLIYHKKLDDTWEVAARQLADSLNVDMIGRSRKQKRVIGRDFVIEELQVGDRVFCYQQVETGFTQPNARVCEKMLTWAVDKSRGFSGDLLELYCGNGNFTLPLAQNFDRVLATELAKSSLASAQYNQELNGIDNLTLVRMSSEDFSQALDKVRPFNRLKDIDLDSYNFSTIFVDPPRAGLDEHTTEVTQRFDNILYISCNPETLRHNLTRIIQSHEIKHFAVFDQFPYTPHLECGVVLQRR